MWFFRLDLKSNKPKSYVDSNLSIDLGGEQIDSKDVNPNFFTPTERDLTPVKVPPKKKREFLQMSASYANGM
jgi:hypothetical protein